MTFAQKTTAMADVADFESLKAAKTQQIADAEDLVETKSGDLATSDEKKASSKGQIEEAQTSLAVDKNNAFMLQQCQDDSNSVKKIAGMLNHDIVVVEHELVQTATFFERLAL